MECARWRPVLRKMCVRRGACLLSTSLTRESQLPVSETYAKKSLSLAHVAPLRPLQIFCSDAIFASLHRTTAHPLCHHWRFRQRLCCHSSLYSTNCVTMSMQKLMILQKKKLLFQFRSFGVKVFPLPCSLRTQKSACRDFLQSSRFSTGPT